MLQVKLVAPPLYVLTTQTLEKDLGIATLTKSIEMMKASIEAQKGKLVVKEAARAVSERDDRLLAEKLDQLAKAQQVRAPLAATPLNRDARTNERRDVLARRIQESATSGILFSWG